MRMPRPPASSRPVIWSRVMLIGKTGSAADVRHLDTPFFARRRGGSARAAAQLRVAVAARVPDVGDRGGDACVARAVAYERAQIVARRREQAQVHLSFRR